MNKDLLEGFSCPTCGDTRGIEQVLLGAEVYTAVEAVTEESPHVRYGDITINDFEREMFICATCGEVLAESEDDLVELLSQQRQ